MPARRPFPRWSDLCPPRAPRPLTAVEGREFHAVRLGLMLALGVIQNGGFVPELQPLQMDYDEVWKWLRQSLKPMAEQSPSVAQAIKLIDLDRRIGWDDPPTLKRHLLRMRAEAPRVAERMRAMPSRTRTPRRTPSPRRVIPV